MLMTYCNGNVSRNCHSSASPMLLETKPESHVEILNGLYRDHSADLMFSILKIVPHQETAEDILHDTFVKMNGCIHTYSYQKAHLLTWSKTVAKNLAIDYVRLKSTRNSRLNQSLDALEFEFGANYSSSFNIEKIGVKQLIAKLNAEERKIIDLFYFKQFTQDEVAKVLNLPLGTVKTRIRKSIKKLRLCFN